MLVGDFNASTGSMVPVSHHHCNHGSGVTYLLARSSGSSSTWIRGYGMLCTALAICVNNTKQLNPQTCMISQTKTFFNAIVWINKEAVPVYLLAIIYHQYCLVNKSPTSTSQPCTPSPTLYTNPHPPYPAHPASPSLTLCTYL